MTEQEIITIIKSKIEAHKQFKAEYNKQLAYDFNTLNFFNPGENKITEILSFFLNPREAHGQGDLFLNEFLKTINRSDIDFNSVSIHTEYLITNNRRIDLFMELSDFIIAIENKIWAIDQPNQLNDYSAFLERESNGKYLLLYLNPYKTNPSQHSIDVVLRDKLESENKFKIISYTTEITEILNSWIAVCEADNVAFFLKQLKLYFKTKFIGNNTINMTQNLKDLIIDNPNEVETLVKAYKEIDDYRYTQIENIAKKIDALTSHASSKLSIKKVGPFDYEGKRIVKVCVSIDSNILWIQLYKDKLNIVSDHYFESIYDIEFRKAFSQLNDYKILDKHLKNDEILEIFIEQLNYAVEQFQKFYQLQ